MQAKTQIDTMYHVDDTYISARKLLSNILIMADKVYHRFGWYEDINTVILYLQ